MAYLLLANAALGDNAYDMRHIEIPLLIAHLKHDTIFVNADNMAVQLIV
jgi:hypothetical protein